MRPWRQGFDLLFNLLWIGTALLWMQRLSGAEWVSAVTWIVAAYMLGHAGAVLAAGWTVQAIAKAKAGAP